MDFVARVTTQGGPDFVPVEQRVATFDNDGTLWVEQPMYVQLAFALDRVKTTAPLRRPGGRTTATLPGGAGRRHEGAARIRRGAGLIEIMMVTHARRQMTTAEFEKIVTDWLATARDAPKGFRRPYTELVQPADA